MGIRSNFAKSRQARRSRRVLRQQASTEKVAYQLYQKRIQRHRGGDESSDWLAAQKIVSNPLRLTLYSMNQAMKPIAAPSVHWFASGVRGKTSWEWMELLLIPLFLAVGAFYLENQVERRQEEIAARRYEQEALIADERAKQETLTSYFEQMKELLLTQQLRESAEESEVRSVARAITTTTIRELDSERNALLISFLKESNLIQKPTSDQDSSSSLLIELRLSRADLRETDLYRADLRLADLNRADLSFTNLSEADLNRSDLSEAIMNRAILSRADLYGADLRLADLRFADLRFADLRFADLRLADLSGAFLSEADLSNAFLNGADLSRANLNFTNLRNADLNNADLNNADLSNAIMSEADLNNAFLSEADLNRTDLSEAIMSGADLNNAFLSEADLNRTDLSNADLSNADLIGADLSNADLSNADLIGADLIGADLNRANLRNADLSNAIVANTFFGEGQGLSESAKADLNSRGAIFADDKD